MCKSFNLVFVAFIGCLASIIGASQLVIVVLYYARLPPIFLVMSLVTGTFVFTLSNCIIGTVISMIRSSVNLTGKVGVILALCLMSVATAFGLLLLLLQCHWIQDQKFLTDIGPFQLQCLKSVADISEGVFLLIMTNAVALGLCLIALLPTCFWEVRSHPDVFQISFISSNWVYENTTDSSNNVTNSDIALTEQNFKQSKRFGKSTMQIPRVNLKSTRRGSMSSSSQLLKNMSSFSLESAEQPQGTFADILAAIPATPIKTPENSLIRLTSFCKTDINNNNDSKGNNEIYQEQANTSSQSSSSESSHTDNNTSTLICTAPLTYPNSSMIASNIKPPSNSDDICHWLKKGKWRKESANRTPATRVRTPSLPAPNHTPPPWINSNTGNPSDSNTPQASTSTENVKLETPPKNKQNAPTIVITPPNENYQYDIKAAIKSLDNVLHLTPSVSTASYRHSESPQSQGCSPI